MWILVCYPYLSFYGSLLYNRHSCVKVCCQGRQNFILFDFLFIKILSQYTISCLHSWISHLVINFLFFILFLCNLKVSVFVIAMSSLLCKTGALFKCIISSLSVFCCTEILMKIFTYYARIGY